MAAQCWANGENNGARQCGVRHSELRPHGLGASEVRTNNISGRVKHDCGEENVVDRRCGCGGHGTWDQGRRRNIHRRPSGIHIIRWLVNQIEPQLQPSTSLAGRMKSHHGWMKSHQGWTECEGSKWQLVVHHDRTECSSSISISITCALFSHLLPSPQSNGHQTRSRQ